MPIKKHTVTTSILFGMFLATLVVLPVAYGYVHTKDYNTKYPNTLTTPIFVAQERFRDSNVTMKFDSVEDIMFYFELQNYTYQNDTYQYQEWKSPYNFIHERGGDCEDFSLFILKTLNDSSCRLYLENSHTFNIVYNEEYGYILMESGVFTIVDKEAYETGQFTIGNVTHSTNQIFNNNFEIIKNNDIFWSWIYL